MASRRIFQQRPEPDPMDEQPEKSSVPSDSNKATNHKPVYMYGFPDTQNLGSSLSYYPSPGQGDYNSIPLPDYRLRMNYSKEDGSTSRNEPTSSGRQGPNTPPVAYSIPPKRQMPVAHIGAIKSETPNIGQSPSKPRCNEGEGKKGDQREDVMYVAGTSRPTTSSTIPPSTGYSFAMEFHEDQSPSYPNYGERMIAPPAPYWHRLYTAPSAAPTREPKSPPSWSHPQHSMLPIPSAQQPMFQMGDGANFSMPPILPGERVEPKNFHHLSGYKLPYDEAWSLKYRQNGLTEKEVFERELREPDPVSTKAESSNSSTRNTVTAPSEPLLFLNPYEALRRERERDLREAEAKGERKLNQTWRSSYGRNTIIPPQNPLLSASEEEQRHPLRKTEARIERKFSQPSNSPTLNKMGPTSQTSKATEEWRSNTQTMAIQDYQMGLLLSEYQNKKKFKMARQEQESKTKPQRPDASGVQVAPDIGCNGQPLQGTSAFSNPSPEGVAYRPKPTPIVNWGPSFAKDTNASPQAPSPSTTMLKRSSSSEFNHSSAALAKEIASRINTQIGCPDGKPANLITRTVAEPEPLDLDAEFSDVMLVDEEHPRAKIEEEDEDWLVV